MNKRRQRTEALIQATARRRIAEQADNTIEQHNFDKLVRSGAIVESGTDTYEPEYPNWCGRQGRG